jgi:hypothetical protein
MFGPKSFGNLFFDQVYGRRDDMARRFVAQLDDVLAEIGLDRRNPVRFKVFVEADFLGDHRLALGDGLGADRSADLQHCRAGLLRGAGPMDLAAGGQHLALIELEIEVEVLEGVVLDQSPGFTERLELRQPIDG